MSAPQAAQGLHVGGFCGEPWGMCDGSCERAARAGEQVPPPADGYQPGPARASQQVSGWEAMCQFQASLYPLGDDGLGYDCHDVLGGRLDVLLWREGGVVVSWLTYCPTDLPAYGPAGTVQLWTHLLHRKHGLSTRLLNAARQRWDLRVEGQNFTGDGAIAVNAYVSKAMQASKQEGAA